MIWKDNPQTLEAGMVFCIRILLDDRTGLSMCLGETAIVTEGACDRSVVFPVTSFNPEKTLKTKTMSKAPWEGMGGVYQYRQRGASDDQRRHSHIHGCHARSVEELQGVDIAHCAVGAVASMPAWTKPTAIRQQSVSHSGYIQELDVDIFEKLRVVDMGDADIAPECNLDPTAENILKAQGAVEELVNRALEAGAIPIVVCSSYGR